MQTRRDQLHAYRFQNRRALAALVTGEPNVVEPPMRRLTVTTLSGIMIAILVTVGFAVYGLIKPVTGDAWKSAGAIVTEQDTGARYVYNSTNKTLYPVLNYTSALLAASGNNQQAHEETVDRDDLRGVKRGGVVGIPGLPDTIPKKSDLVSSPVSVCSRQQGAPDSSNNLTARVTVGLGTDDGVTALPGGRGVVVDTGGNTAQFLLTNGKRYAITNNQVTFNLKLDVAQPLQVGTAFLSGVPAGPNLGTPRIPRQGLPSSVLLGGRAATVGQLLITDGRYRLVLSDGVASLTDVEAALLKTLKVGPGGTQLPPVPAADGAFATSSTWSTIESSTFGQLPTTLPTPDNAANAAGGICLVYASGSGQPFFGVPASLIPQYHNNTVTESATSRADRADQVELTYGKGALVQGDGKTVFFVDDTQQRFAAGTPAVLDALGYGGVTPTKLSSSILDLIRLGPAMDPKLIRES